MSWVEERLHAEKERIERINTISNTAQIVFDELWKAVLVVVGGAKRGGMQVRTNGSERGRKVIATVREDPSPTAGVSQRQVEIVLSDDNQKVEVTGDVSLVFTLGICNTTEVCLFDDRKQISSDDAARRILDPLLFPHLQL